MNFLKFRLKNRYNIKVEAEEFSQLVLMHIFPEMLNRRTFRVSSSEVYKRLKQLLVKQMSDGVKADFIAKQFILELPLLHKELIADAHYIAQNDPAASGIDEVLLHILGLLQSALIAWRTLLQVKMSH